MEVMGRYLNHSDQGKCLRNLLEMVPTGSKTAKTRTPRRVCRRLGPAKVDELIQGYAEGVPMDELAARFQIDQSTVQRHARRHDLARRSPRLGQTRSRKQFGSICLVSLLPSFPINSVLRPTLWHLPYEEPGLRYEHDEGGTHDSAYR